jgi:phosphate transport system permease protein
MALVPTASAPVRAPGAHAPTAPMASSIPLRPPPSSRLPDQVFDGALVALACTVLAALLLVSVQLANLARPAMHQFGWGFLWSSEWDPTTGLFGAFPFLIGTLVTAFEALVVAVPLGLGTAIFLSEMADRRLERWIRFPIEMLAAVPSVVYGLWGLGRLAPLLREHVEPLLARTGLGIFSGPQLGVGVLAAGLVLAVMVFPTVVALSLEVFRAVPHEQREAFFALGATRWEMIRRGLLPFSRTGLFGAILLALGRALGETMAVAMVIGNSPDLTRSLFGTGATLASVIANEFTEAVDDVHRAALAELGLVLLGMTLVIAVLARLILRAAGRDLRARV